MRPHTLATRPTASVVIPCYNYGHYLPDAVASALDQEDLDVEVLIVDDASTDDSAEVARQLAESDARVEVLLHETNRGHIATYNDGLAKVRGDYVALLSADDLLTPNALTRAVALMEHHPSVGMVYGFARSFSGAPPTMPDGVRSWKVWTGQSWLRLATRRAQCFLASPEAVMRREALLETDFYDPRLPFSGDLDMWLRTACRWDIGRVNGPAQALYRVHDDNLHLTTFAGWVIDLLQRRATFEILFEERAPHRADVRALRPGVMRKLAREGLRRAVAAHRDDPDSPDADALMAFAATTDPAIATTLRWGLACRAMRRPWFQELVTLHQFAEHVGLHVAWRRRRRFGT